MSNPGSGRSSFDMWRNTSMEVFSMSSRHEEDDEESLTWAAIERLPTYLRTRRGLLAEEEGKAREIDVTNLGLLERKNLLERLVKIAEEDNEKFLLKLKDRMNRYAYAVASALHGVRHILREDFMLQPPWDLKVGKRFIIHYTYGCDYNLKGDLTYGKIGEWRFDKRAYLSGPPPRNLSLPPPGVPESVVRLVKMVNEATANIPGWDS